jgi:phage terminase large subunit-like protein
MAFRPANADRKPRPKNSKRAQRNIDWIEKYCRVPEGPSIGHRVRLRDWQCDEIRKIYGNPKGTRRAIISFARKNGKTAFVAMLLLLHLCGPEKVLNSQLYSAAQSREQAAIIFHLACKIVRMSPELRAVVVVRDSAKQLLCPDLGTVYRALSAEASTAFGLSPVFIVHDELGQVRGPRSPMYEALETATGAQEAPLSIIISTQAPSDADLLSILIDDALTQADPRVICSLYTAPQELDPFAEATIKMANPAFGDFLNKEEVMAMANDASRMPAREAEFRNLVLNQRVEVLNPFVSRAAWKACGAPVADLHGVQLYGGLDLASVADLCALVLIGKVERVWHVQPTFWLPTEGLREKSQHDRTPYDLWKKQGHLLTTPGNSVSYEYVAEYLYQLFQEYNIRKLAFDDWGMVHLKPWLLKAGFSEQFIEEHFHKFRQGGKTMAPALRDLEQMIAERELAHGNHPVLAMCAACAVIDGKDDSTRRLSKNKSTGRIDGMVALAMAAGVAPLVADVDIGALIG